MNIDFIAMKTVVFLLQYDFCFYIIEIGITFLSFAMMRVAGSDAVTEMYENRGTAVSQEIIDAKKAELGLDQPFLVQYVNLSLIHI